jgi:hypothetical protein
LLDDLCARFVINIRESQEPSAFKVEVVIGNLKSHKSPSIDHIQPELFIACCRTIFSEITELLDSIRNKEGMLEEWKETVILPIS